MLFDLLKSGVEAANDEPAHEEEANPILDQDL
jgi:hypothetical protein